MTGDFFTNQQNRGQPSVFSILTFLIVFNSTDNRGEFPIEIRLRPSPFSLTSYLPAGPPHFYLLIDVVMASVVVFYIVLS
jgi:hypothetical protein